MFEIHREARVIGVDRGRGRIMEDEVREVMGAQLYRTSEVPVMTLASTK